MVAEETHVPLHSTDVEAWFVDLDGVHDRLDNGAEEILSEDEQRRAERMLSVLTRQRYVTGRVFLRIFLGDRLGLDPADIAFAYGPFGKPRLAMAGRRQVEFNLSHADEWAFIGLSTVGRVGVDLERFQDIQEWEEMALVCFPAEERLRLAAAPESERVNAFVRAWTKREALLKALGWGWAGSALRSRAPFAPGLVTTEVVAPNGFAAVVAHSAGARLQVAHVTPDAIFATATRSI